MSPNKPSQRIIPAAGKGKWGCKAGDAWPTLPEAVRTRIVGMVKAAPLNRRRLTRAARATLAAWRTPAYTPNEDFARAWPQASYITGRVIAVNGGM